MSGRAPFLLVVYYCTELSGLRRLCRLLFEKAKVNDALLFMTILSTDLKGEVIMAGIVYILISSCPTNAYALLVDKILKQQQQDRKMAEEARRSRYIGSETSDSATTLVPQPVAPRPQKANPPDSIAARSKSPTRRPGLPGGWEPAPGSSPPHAIPPPVATPSLPEMSPNESGTARTPITPTTPEPSNNAFPIGNALQNLRRKLVSHMPSSSEIVRSTPSPQVPQYASYLDCVLFANPFYWIGIRDM